MSTISAGTTTTTALVQTGDTTGNLVLATGSVPTTALTLNSTTQAATFAGAVTAPSVTTTGTINTANTFGFKNRIINGGMGIWQRGTSFTGLASSSSTSTYCADRFAWNRGNGTSGVVSVTQSSDVPSGSGFPYSFLTTVTTASASMAASEYNAINQIIEGFNCSDLAYGTASAKTVTLSFWVKSSVTGTYNSVMFQRGAATNRSFPFQYSIPVANTWTQISVTITGDTGGTIPFSNAAGLEIDWYLGMGSNYQSGTANTWNVNTSNNQYTAGSATNLLATNGATFYITGVQLEVGSQATSFDFRDYGRELMLCQRYFWRTYSSTSNNFICWVYAVNTVDAYGYLYFPVSMRSSPSAVTYVGTGWWAGGAVTAASSVTIAESGTGSATLRFVSTGYAANTMYAILPNGSSANYVALTAEL